MRFQTIVKPFCSNESLHRVGRDCWHFVVAMVAILFIAGRVAMAVTVSTRRDGGGQSLDNRRIRGQVGFERSEARIRSRCESRSSAKERAIWKPLKLGGKNL